jgi:hypothetical protein
MKNYLLTVLILLVLAVTGLNWVTTRVNVDQIIRANAIVEAQGRNQLIVNNMVAYAFQRDQHAFVFAQAAKREQEIANQAKADAAEAMALAERIYTDAQIYVGLCHQKLDDAKIARPTPDEFEAAQAARKALEEAIRQMTEKPEVCPVEGEPQPAAPQNPEPTPATPE